MISYHHRYISTVFRPDESRWCFQQAELCLLFARGHECRCGHTATRAIKGSCLMPLRPGLRDMTLPEWEIVTEIMGRRDEYSTEVRQEAGMTGKHLITDTFTIWWRHMLDPDTQWLGASWGDIIMTQSILQQSTLPKLEKNLLEYRTFLKNCLFIWKMSMYIYR